MSGPPADDTSASLLGAGAAARTGTPSDFPVVMAAMRPAERALNGYRRRESWACVRSSIGRSAASVGGGGGRVVRSCTIRCTPARRYLLFNREPVVQRLGIPWCRG